MSLEAFEFRSAQSDRLEQSRFGGFALEGIGKLAEPLPLWMRNRFFLEVTQGLVNTKDC